MFAVALDPTAEVVMLNPTAVPPAATVTVEGTVADGLSDFSVITAPPAGAGDARLTLAVPVAPPISEFWFRLMTNALAALTVNVADAEVPLPVAVMVPVVLSDVD
jgi:hypothetical protein